MVLKELPDRIWKKMNRIGYSLMNKKVQCNICLKEYRLFFSDVWHLYTICPNCGSQVRHRLLFASLQRNNFFDRIINDKSVLHFAPERILGKIISERAANYKSADFFMESYSYDNIDYNLDISSMKEISDLSFDCVIACDILEHVPDDIAALNEVYRILKKDGYGIFTVPQKDNLEKTDEDISITDPKLREQRFGQFDHMRIYGRDFIDRLKKAGFEVEVIDERAFDNEVVKKNVLFPPVLSRNPLATNFRKIYYAKKY